MQAQPVQFLGTDSHGCCCSAGLDGLGLEVGPRCPAAARRAGGARSLSETLSSGSRKQKALLVPSPLSAVGCVQVNSYIYTDVRRFPECDAQLQECSESGVCRSVKQCVPEVCEFELNPPPPPSY